MRLGQYRHGQSRTSPIVTTSIRRNHRQQHEQHVDRGSLSPVGRIKNQRRIEQVGGGRQERSVERNRAPFPQNTKDECAGQQVRDQTRQSKHKPEHVWIAQSRAAEQWRNQLFIQPTKKPKRIKQYRRIVRRRRVIHLQIRRMDPVAHGFPGECDISRNVTLFPITRDIAFIPASKVKRDPDKCGERENNQDTQSLVSRERPGHNSRDQPNERSD